MNVELVTRQDFLALKNELLNELRSLFQKPVAHQQCLKSAAVMEILQCSPGTLQNLRVNGLLPFSKLGGTIYYELRDVQNLLEKNKQNAA